MAVAITVTGAGESQAQECRVVEVHMTPTDDLQMVVWIEDAAGNFVDTAFITRSTGVYGLGNRPGMMQFKSAYRWPYGRRTTTFPVWSHRHGQTWPLVVFQNWNSESDPINYLPDSTTSPDENLSHPATQSSSETYFCRPLLATENDPAIDAESCATTPGVLTDKGVFHPSATSVYPPRSDLTVNDQVDSEDALAFRGMNPFDGISRATPAGGEPYAIAWAIPQALPNGDYVAYVEVSKEQDSNAFYNETDGFYVKDSYGEADVMWGQYGIPYLGQPSVVYQVPFSVTTSPLMMASSDTYAGYGDPDGIDGNIRVPDATITTDVVGSGASRLMLVSDDGVMHRVKTVIRNEDDSTPPAPIEELRLVDTSTNSASLTFMATGDDGMDGRALSYEVRYLAGEPISEESFDRATPASVSIQPVEAGLQIDFTMTELLPRTNYYVGVKAVDNCLNASPLATVLVTTPVPTGGEVDACFIATAAYGTALADDVTDLRQFRDVFLRSHVAGELLVEAYYTFGPVLAETIRPSETLRALVREMLSPVVLWARHMLATPAGR